VPFALIRDLLKHADDFHDVEICHIHTLGDLPWVDDKYKGSFRTNTFFMTRDIRSAVEIGIADYTPCPTFDIPRLFRMDVLPLDVALIQVSPPDADGMVSLGLSADVVCAAVKSAKVVVAQINKHMPRTHGDTVIPLKKCHYTITHHALPKTKKKWHYSEEHKRAAMYAAQLIEDGSTIQASLGNSPQAVLNMLKDHENLGIHTGCFTNAMMRLMKCGAVNNSMKSQQQGVSVASHCLGSKALYEFVKENPEILLKNAEWTNDPHRVGRHKMMVAINGAREVDLTGQVVRDSRGHHFYGGIGATQDFIRGAGKSKGGRPIIVMTSTDDECGESRIVTGLAAGSGVCTSRSDVHYVVTEYGVANLVGQSIRQRVLRLVEVAHPKFREELLEGARAQGWIPKVFAAKPTNIYPDLKRIDSKKVKFGGVEYIVRPLHPSDLRAIQEFFYAQDEETIRLRYGHSKPDLDEMSAYTMASVSQEKDLALGIFYHENFRDELRATGRFYLDPGGETAEVSFLVHEKTRRSGMGNFLLCEMAAIAADRGVKKFWASVLKKNVSMAELFLKQGAKRKRILGEDCDEFWMDTKKLKRNARKLAMPRAKAAIKKRGAAVALEVKKDQLKDHGLGVYFSEKMLEHNPGGQHPESVARYQALLESLKASKLHFTRVAGRAATVEDITRVHSPSYHDMAKYDIENFADKLRTGDTFVCDASYDVAMAASGAAMAAVDEVMEGRLSRVFCAVRPPGHHASADLGMGFCIFNHAAVAARYAQHQYGIERVAILDWDVHHGNGTQDIFYEDGSVFYFSSHQEGLFPYTGLAEEVGEGDGLNTTVNVPMKARSGDVDVLEVWGDPLLQRLKRFKPELIIISAGFDICANDPLADFKMTPHGIGCLTNIVRQYANTFCGGKLVSILEGGYEVSTLPGCVEQHLEALVGAREEDG